MKLRMGRSEEEDILAVKAVRKAIGWDHDLMADASMRYHLKLAQRIIGGGVVGTMGTPVEVLHQRQEHVLYKELWDVRNEITAKTTGSDRDG